MFQILKLDFSFSRGTQGEQSDNRPKFNFYFTFIFYILNGVELYH